MLKLGVCKPEQFFSTPPESWLSYVYYRLSRSRISLSLLETAAKSTGSVLFERLMPHVRISNGVFRTTFRRRFRNLDPIVNSRLAKYFSSPDNLVIEDWAASACLTSAEWAESLFPLFPHLQFAASDLMLFLIAVKDPQSEEILVTEPDGRPLQYINPPFVIRMVPPEPWMMPFNRLGYLRARSRWQNVQRLWPLPDEWLDSDRWEEPLERDGYQLCKLPLIHPEALSLARKDPRFSIRRHSVFEPAESRAHVIRSMNILNRKYFPDEQLIVGIRSVIASLQDGGIWIVGRTASEDPPLHDVTMFQKLADGRLEPIERMGAGSEIDSLCDSLVVHSQSGPAIPG